MGVRKFSRIDIFVERVTSFGGFAPSVLIRFFRYLLASSGTLLFDIFLLGLLAEFFGIHYLFSVSFAYVVSTTINYFINRHWGFRGTKRHVVSGYLLFLSFGLLGLFLTVSLMWLFVDFIGWHYSFSRIVVAIIEGAILFILNSIYTFKVPLMEMVPYQRTARRMVRRR